MLETEVSYTLQRPKIRWICFNYSCFILYNHFIHGKNLIIGNWLLSAKHNRKEKIFTDIIGLILWLAWFFQPHTEVGGLLFLFRLMEVFTRRMFSLKLMLRWEIYLSKGRVHWDLWLLKCRMWIGKRKRFLFQLLATLNNCHTALLYSCLVQAAQQIDQYKSNGNFHYIQTKTMSNDDSKLLAECKFSYLLKVEVNSLFEFDYFLWPACYVEFP